MSRALGLQSQLIYTNGTMISISAVNIPSSLKRCMRNLVSCLRTRRVRRSRVMSGPIIRINPDEIHIDDPDYFEEVFNQMNGRAQKPVQVAEAFGPYPAVSRASQNTLLLLSDTR